MADEVEADVSWWSRQAHLRLLPYARRSVGQEFYKPNTAGPKDTLVFNGAVTDHNFPLPNTERWGRPALEAQVYVHRNGRESALKDVKDLAFITGRESAYQDERAKQWVNEWDTQFWFESAKKDHWSVVVSTYAQPELYDRILTLPLTRCVLSVDFSVGVLSPKVELDKSGPHNASDLGRLPTPRKDVDGGPQLRTNTAGHLVSLSVIENWPPSA